MNRDVKIVTPIPVSRPGPNPKRFARENAQALVGKLRESGQTCEVTIPHIVESILILQMTGTLDDLASIYQAYTQWQLHDIRYTGLVTRMNTADENFDLLCGGADNLQRFDLNVSRAIRYAENNPNDLGPIRKRYREISGYRPPA